jgi:hypothetical protein
MINHKLLSLFEGQDGNYSNPANRERLLHYLMKQKKMFDEFVDWSWNNKWVNDTKTKLDCIPWFFLPYPDSDIPRWIILLQEWLQLRKTIRIFGYIRCPDKGRFKDFTLLKRCESCPPQACVNSQVKAEWANDSSTSNKKRRQQND